MVANEMLDSLSFVSVLMYRHSKSAFLQMITNFELKYINIRSRCSNIYSSIFFFAQIESKREIMYDIFFCLIGKAIKVKTIYLLSYF